MKVVSHRKLDFSRLGGLVILGSACFLGQVCQGRQDAVQPAGAASPQWIAGPAKADLGGIAQLSIPEGYRFVGRDGAALVMHTAVPKNVVGLLAPASSKWFGIIEYSEPGYIKDLDTAHVDTTAILAEI